MGNQVVIATAEDDEQTRDLARLLLLVQITSSALMVLDGLLVTWQLIDMRSNGQLSTHIDWHRARLTRRLRRGRRKVSSEEWEQSRRWMWHQVYATLYGLREA